MNEIAAALSLFFSPGDVFEVRILGADGSPRRTRAGWFRAESIARAATKIAEYSARASGVYFTPQRLNTSIYSLCANVIDRPARLTRDDDVTERRWLIVDIDPVRAAGHEKDGATDSEKQTAFDVATEVRGFMAEHDWPRPIVVDSGNGCHLYYRLANAEPGGPVADWRDDPIARLLHCLAARFDNRHAKIDTSVYNASRIMKIPGTLARKGRNSKDRPHRISRVVEAG